MKKLPYFDYLLAYLQSNNDNNAIEKSFGRHVHWGYWESPKQATLTVDEFAQATEKLSQLIIKSANITDGQAVLDVGCGFGGTIASLNEHYNGLQLVGLNIDERQLQRARQQVQALNNNNIKFQQGDACALPFLDGSFDVILAVECIFHFPSREQFFQEAYRVLKPGGYLALSDFILSDFSPVKLTRHINSGFFGSCNVGYTQKKYRALAKKTGFTVCVDNNITKNILPTYRYLKSLLRKKDQNKPTAKGLIMAFFTTFAIELITRSGLLNYVVFAFQKPN